MSGCPENEWGYLAKEREQARRCWARACQTFFAAVLEHCGGSVGVDMVRILIGGNLYGPRPFEENRQGVTRALEYMLLQDVRESYRTVAHDLLNFARCLDDERQRVPTCAELEGWYSRVRGRARDLLERRAL